MKIQRYLIAFSLVSYHFWTRVEKLCSRGWSQSAQILTMSLTFLITYYIFLLAALKVLNITSERLCWAALPICIDWERKLPVPVQKSLFDLAHQLEIGFYWLLLTWVVDYSWSRFYEFSIILLPKTILWIELQNTTAHSVFSCHSCL